MLIKGRRRGGAKALSDHLRKEENERVTIQAIEGFSFSDLDGQGLEKAIKQMEAQGYGKGDKRNLYHAILAPAYGETLTKEQRDFMVNYYIEHMGFKGHQYALVEHWKNGKQHFHLVVNIINPDTGKTHELKWTKRKEWQISRGLEQIFGHVTPVPKGKAAQTWEMQRSKRTGVDPRKMRKDITAIYKVCPTAQEFITALDRIGLTLTMGRDNRLVLIDMFGDPHGLIKRIEGVTLANLREKFVGIEQMSFTPYAELVKTRKKANPKIIREPIDPEHVRKDVQKAYRTSKTGAEFFAKLNKCEYALGRGMKGFAVVDINGNRHDFDQLLGKQAAKGLNKKFPDLAAIRPRPVSELMRRLKNKASDKRPRTMHRRTGGGGVRKTDIGTKQQSTALAFSFTHNSGLTRALFRQAMKTATTKPDKQPVPNIPAATKTGWPEAAILDWETWGHRNPPRFFALWPELS